MGVRQRKKNQTEVLKSRQATNPFGPIHQSLATNANLIHDLRRPSAVPLRLRALCNYFAVLKGGGTENPFLPTATNLIQFLSLTAVTCKCHTQASSEERGAEER